jgi:hypothetical protein
MRINLTQGGKMKRFLLCFTIVLLFVSPSLIYGQHFNYQSSILWTDITDIKVIGNYAYYLYIPGLKIFDVSNPQNALLLSELYIPNASTSIAVKGNYAYVLGMYYGLTIIDISNPSNPTIISRLTINGTSNNIFVDSSFAFIANSGNGLKIVNVVDPIHPTLESTYDTPGECKEVFVKDENAFISDGNGGFEIVDVSNPSIPSLIAHDTTKAISIYVSDDIAYICNDITYNIDLSLFDVSQRSNPIPISSNDIPGSAEKTIVMDSLCYVEGSAGLSILNCSNPGNPVLLSTYPFPDSFIFGTGICLSNNYVYIYSIDAYSDRCYVQTIDVSNPNELQQINYYRTCSGVYDVQVDGQYLYVANDIDGIKIFNITNSQHPLLIGSYDTPGYARHIKLDGDILYVADYGVGVQLISLEDRTNPQLISTFPANWAFNLDIVGNYAFVVGPPIAYGVVSYQDPANPVLVGSYSIYDLQTIQISGSHVFLGGASGLGIFDVYPLEAPHLAGGVDMSGVAISGIAVRGNYAYLSGYGSQGVALGIYSLANMQHPVQVGYFIGGGVGMDIKIFGNNAILGGGRDGIYLLSMSNPRTPQLIENYQVPHISWQIEIDENNVYIANQSSVIILDHDLTEIDSETKAPSEFGLSQCYPNPFNAQTSISYFLAKAGPVVIEIYNIVGQKIITLVDEIEQAGEHKMIWDAKDFPSGVYFANLKAGEKTESIKMVLLK